MNYLNHLKRYNSWRLSQAPHKLIQPCVISSLFLFMILCFLFSLSTGIVHASENTDVKSRTSHISEVSLTATPSFTPTPTPSVAVTQSASNIDAWVAVITPLASVIVVLLGGGVAALGYLYRHERERREEVERQLSEHKYKTYMALMDMYIEVIKAGKAGKPLKPEDLVDRMQELAKDFIVYGSDNVVRAFQKWVETGRKGGVSVRQFGELVVTIRRDMGNKKTTITYEEVLRQFINDYDDAKAKGLI